MLSLTFKSRVRREAAPALAARPQDRSSSRLATHVGPRRIRLHPTYAQVGDDYVRGLVLHEWPRMIVPGLWADITDGDLPVTMSWGIDPLDQGLMLERLRTDAGWYQALVSSGQHAGAVTDYGTSQAWRDTERMREALATRTEQLFYARVHFLLRAPDLPTLDRYTRDLERRIRGLGGRARVCTFEQDRALRACQPHAVDETTHARRIVPTTALAYSYPWAQDSLRDPAGAFFGIQTARPEPVHLDLARRGTLNLTCFGKSGNGKGYLLKNLALGLALDGVAFLGVDQQATREWEGVCRQIGGDYVVIQPGDGPATAAINVFETERVDEDDTFGRSPLEEQVEAVREFVGMLVSRPNTPLEPIESAVLVDAILRTYARAGIHLERPETHGLRAPTLRDLLTVLDERGRSDHTAQSLALRLTPHVVGPMRGLFARPTTMRRDAPAIIWNLAQVPPAVRPAVLHLVSVEAWRRIRRQEAPTIFLMDEGYTMIQHPEGREFASRLAVGVRQYWGGLWFVSQQATGCLRLAREVFDNASVHLYFHNPRTDAHVIATEAGLSQAAEDYIVGAAEGEYLLEDTDRRILVGVKMEATPLGEQLATTRPAELAQRRHGSKRRWAFWQWMGVQHERS